MVNKLHIQIVDNTFDAGNPGVGSQDSFTNKYIADSLQKELSDDYPSMVAVEYVDLYFEDSRRFRAVRHLLDYGEINLPVILFNGVPKLHGTVVPSLIREEVERVLESGPLH